MLILSVPDEGYDRNASCAQNLASTFLSVYSANTNKSAPPFARASPPLFYFKLLKATMV